MTEELKIVGIAGSLREGSLNRALLEAAAKLAPDGIVIKTFALDDVPLYRAELDNDDPPAAVRALKAAITEADGVLIATPEFNYGVPGVLKNAIDWASRPGYRSPLRDKPVAVIGAAPGVVGTARAQGQLKQNLLGLAAAVFPWPEYLLGGAKDKLVNGELENEKSRELLTGMLGAFGAWVRAVKLYQQR